MELFVWFMSSGHATLTIERKEVCLFVGSFVAQFKLLRPKSYNLMEERK
jgi:hypothetical protein